jgi:hypothetical protein
MVTTSSGDRSLLLGAGATITPPSRPMCPLAAPSRASRERPQPMGGSIWRTSHGCQGHIRIDPGSPRCRGADGHAGEGDGAEPTPQPCRQPSLPGESGPLQGIRQRVPRRSAMSRGRPLRPFQGGAQSQVGEELLDHRGLFNEAVLRDATFFTSLLHSTGVYEHGMHGGWRFCGRHPYFFVFARTREGVSQSKYPPAEPGALRALAPQRGLTARGGPSEYNIRTLLRLVDHCHTVRSLRKSTLPELSNFGSPPAEPGVYSGELQRPAQFFVARAFSLKTLTKSVAPRARLELAT